jgi:glycosyltransferase involved in cell wall biosynthesis
VSKCLARAVHLLYKRSALPMPPSDAPITLELSIVLPCLNEAETLAACIDKAVGFLTREGVAGEIVIADNGSSDGSQAIAVAHGARVVAVAERGYGAALMGGFRAAKGRYVIMADADDSYDLANLSPFLEQLRAGFDLVMGNRFAGGIKPGAMPTLHRYLGNPVLSGIGRLFFRTPARDFHCGIRGFSKEALERLDLHTTGMEFASEMVVKAALCGLRMTEVPTTLSPDGRSRPPHLRSWRDGWRHLRFLLIYSPRWLFLYPGMLLLLLGSLTTLTLMPGPRTVYGITFDIHTMLYASTSVLVGLQAIVLAVFSKGYAVHVQLLPAGHSTAGLLRMATLERGLLLGGLTVAVGLAGSLYAFLAWGHQSFGPLIPGSMMRIVIPSLTALTAGFQIMFASFFLGVLGVKHR